MKKLSVLFSIFTVLMAVIFTSCEDPAKTMEPFTKDMIGEWMIGTWDISSSSKETVVQGEEEQTTESITTGTYEIKGIEDDSEVIMTLVSEGVEQEKKGTFEDFKKTLFPETEETEGVTMNVSSSSAVPSPSASFTASYVAVYSAFAVTATILGVQPVNS